MTDSQVMEQVDAKVMEMKEKKRRRRNIIYVAAFIILAILFVIWLNPGILGGI